MFQRINSYARRVYYRRYHTHYRQAVYIFILDSGLFALIVGLLGVTLFFLSRKIEQPAPLIVWLTTEQPVLTSGSSTQFIINYQNSSKSLLKNVTFDFFSPPGALQEETGLPTPLLSTTVAEISPQAHGTIQLPTTTIWFDPTQPFRAHSRVTFSSDRVLHEDIFSHNITTTASVLTNHFEIDHTSYPHELVHTTSTIRNNSQKTIPLTINLTATSSTNQIPYSLTSYQQIILPNEQKIITSTFRALDDPDTYSLELLTNAQPLEKPQEILQSRHTGLLHVELPRLISWLSNSSANSSSMSVFWQNASDKMAYTTILTFTTEPRITWNIPTLLLGTLAPGATGTITIPYPKISQLPTTTESLIITPFLYTHLHPLQPYRLRIPGKPLIIPHETTLNLSAEIRYFSNEGDQLGRGPLPPKQGEATRYWLHITAQSASQALEKTTLELTLGSTTRFTGKQNNARASDNLSIASDMTRAIWHGSLPTTSPKTWYIELNLTPDEHDVGTLPTLVKTVTLTGFDQEFDTAYHITSTPLNTVMPPTDKGRALGSYVIP
jgi:hypothetical protein